MKIPLFLAIILLGLQIPAEKPGAPSIGTPAPDFSLPYATRDSISFKGITLKSIVGTSNIILAFYPADWSGGCTKELCTFRDEFSGLVSLHAEILAISGDSPFAHHEWAKQLNLPVRLLSDNMHIVARLYNSFNEKTGYNLRTVFVVDKAGRIAYVDAAYNVQSPDSFHKLQDALAKLH